MATYQASAAPICDTLAHYIAWGQFLGGGFSAAGWSAQSGHGEVVASGTGATYAWTNAAAAPTVGLTIAQSYTFKGAWVSGNTYVGGNTANLATEVDVVTYGGNTYVHITASSNSASTPAADTTNWQPFNFEIWKSNGSNTSSLPIYVRLVYTTAGSNAFRIHMQIGTGVDANGNLTGTVTLTATTPTNNISIDNGTNNTGTMGELDFSGDADNCRFILWRGGPAAGYNSALVIDRAKTATGADSDAYVYIGSALTAASTAAARNSIILKSALGGVLTQATTGWLGVVSNSGAHPTTGFGATPAYPIFPILGFVGNPLLGAVGVVGGDVPDGTILPVWMYGASHNFLCNTYTTAAGSALNNIATNGVYVAIRWE
jgi:hypothetical protein